MKTILLAGILVSCAAAQIPTEPPNLIRVVRNGSIQPYADGKAAVNVLGMSATSGLSETWMLELHDSFGSLEDLDKALKTVASARPPSENAALLPDDVLAPSRAVVGVYRPALSYLPGQAIRIFPTARYFDIMVCRIRPGSEADFAGLVKLREFRFDSINLDRPEIVYQVISGAPSGTYIFLAPLPSLRMMDNGRPFTPTYAEVVEAAARKKAADTEIARQHLWFRIEPRMSYVSEEFASPDPGFWHPTPR